MVVKVLAFSRMLLLSLYTSGKQVNFSIPGKFVSTKVYRLTSQVKSGIIVFIN